MEKGIPGIHHVTAIAGEPQTNLDFYAGVLGLRLVKLTVNFDDPTTYHLYYGDGQGHPGTILTFFPWPDAMHGLVGTGQVTATSFAVPERALEFWKNHLQKHGIQCQREQSAFGEELLALADRDGLPLELVSTAEAEPDRAWEQGPLPPEHAIRGFHHVTLTEEGYERTAVLLTETMGFRLSESKGNRFRYAAPATAGSKAGTIVDVVCTPAGRPGLVAVGTVHHVAWRTPTDEQQAEWRQLLSGHDYNVTPVIDRKYFHSIYSVNREGCSLKSRRTRPGLRLMSPPTSWVRTCCCRTGWSLIARSCSKSCPNCACHKRGDLPHDSLNQVAVHS